MTDQLSVFVFEPDPQALERCTAVISEAGYHPVPTARSEEAAALLEDPGLCALLISCSAPGIALSRYVHELAGCTAPLLALTESSQPEYGELLTQMAADGVLVRPFSPSALQSVLSVATRLAQLRHELEQVRLVSKDQPQQLRRLASAINSRTGFYQFELMKDVLVIEVRRAKRYGYPLAVLLVGLDEIPQLSEAQRPVIQREITGGLAVAIAKSIRDIDIPTHYADDRILVFLPHTDLAGAEEVGRRIKRRIKRITYRGEGITVQLTASVGIAGISEGESLTFSRLIKDATAALKAAQLKGGDRVMKRTSRPLSSSEAE